MTRSSESTKSILRRDFNSLRLFAGFFITSLLIPSILAQTNGGRVLDGHISQEVARSQVISRMPATTRLSLAIGLPLRNQEELDSLLVQLSDPGSPKFGHYLSAQEFAAEFGPTEQDYQTLIQFAEQNGLTVTEIYPNRVLLDVAGTVQNIEKALHVNMVAYRHPTRGDFYAPDREPSLDSDLAVLDVSGLDNFSLPHPMDLKTVPFSEAKPYVTGGGPGGYFIGKDFRAAYAANVSLTGSGQVVGLLEFDGFYAGDVLKNSAQAGVSAVTTQTVLLDGVSGVPGGSNIEVILDIMMASYMAPGLSKVIVYEGSNPNDILNRMATDNLAQQLSSSWGYSPINATTEQIFKQFIAQGQSILQASGDSGAYSNGVMAPSDDPNLTVVGGTSLTTSGAGGPWQSESAWSGSGGGISTLYTIPSYQQGFSMSANGGSTRMRNIPDVALTADIQMYLVCNNGQAVVVGGTSAAAPLWAGFIALANQQATSNAKPRVGFLNPPIYSIGKNGSYGSDFNDILHGSNGYSAVTGYDLATGWGSPAGQHLIYDLTGTSGGPSFTLSASAAALSVKQASTGTGTLTVADQNGFTGSVNLGVTGLPSGVTAAFSPTATITSSKVTFTVGPSTPAGSYPLTVNGTSGSLSGTTVITLTVVSPSFSLSTSPASLTVPRSTSGSSTLTVLDQNGFTGSVNLGVTGLPSGVTAVFSPAATITSSKVTFTVGPSTPAGSYPLTVNGTSGSLSGTTALTLTVVSPSFSLSTSPASLTVPRSTSGSSTLTVLDQNGFTGNVNLGVTGLPSGVTAAFSPAATITSSKVTFTVGPSTSAGSYPLTVNGTSGSLSGTTVITLTVVSPSFSLSTSPASLTVPRSTSGSSALTVLDQNGFTGSVNLGVTGLPSGVTAAFSPSSTTSKSSLMFSANSSAIPGTYTVSVNGVSGTLTGTTTIGLNITAPNFALSFQPANLGLPRGSMASGTLTITPQNGFQGSVSLSAAGLPSGVTASFGAITAFGASQVTFTSSSTATAGTFAVTLNGVSGSLKNGASFTLSVLVPTAGTSMVILSPAFNINGLVTDGVPFTGNGLDGGLNGSITAYSANLTGVEQTIGGVAFYFGPANALDAVSAKTVSLPPGQFSTIMLLATAVNGYQPAQVFKVTYSDGSASTFTQNLSDWFTPQNFSGETKAITMPYRDNGQGQRDNRTFYLYEYKFTLSANKTVASITLPNNRNVVVVAASLTGAATVSNR
jgi:subtilase family serine protease